MPSGRSTHPTVLPQHGCTGTSHPPDIPRSTTASAAVSASAATMSSYPQPRMAHSPERLRIRIRVMSCLVFMITHTPSPISILYPVSCIMYPVLNPSFNPNMIVARTLGVLGIRRGSQPWPSHASLQEAFNPDPDPNPNSEKLVQHSSSPNPNSNPNPNTNTNANPDPNTNPCRSPRCFNPN